MSKGNFTEKFLCKNLFSTDYGFSSAFKHEESYLMEELRCFGNSKNGIKSGANLRTLGMIMTLLKIIECHVFNNNESNLVVGSLIVESKEYR